MKNAVKQLKAFQFTRTFMRHLLNITSVLSKRQKCLMFLNIIKSYLFNLAKNSWKITLS